MRVKKFFSMVLAGVTTLSLLAGCSSSTTSTSTTAASTTASTTAASITSEPQTAQTQAKETESTGSKVLVVYYSATGSTKAVAETIAKTTGGDLFKIEPVEPYTDDDLDWTNDSSRVSTEHNDESKRNVELTKVTPDNWDSYDTVLIGYPIWWGIAAWTVDNFVKGNDFSGKTVIPFCTSASSGLGDSGDLLEEMAGTGDWKEGQRFSSGASEADVTSWVDSLGL